MPSTKVLVAIAKILKEEGYIDDFEVIEKRPQNQLRHHAALRRGQAARDPRDQAGQQAGSARLRRQGRDSARPERSRHRDRQHAAGRHDRLRGPAPRYRRRGSLHRLLASAVRPMRSHREGGRQMSRIGRRPITVPSGVEVDDRRRTMRSRSRGRRVSLPQQFSPRS